MTTLNYDALIASFPDNTTGLITAEASRNFVDSVELKYQNWVVVKPTQPNGNAFPAPSGGFITLAADTVYLINGEVTVLYPIKFSDGSFCVGLSGGVSSNSVLALDGSLSGVSLFSSVGTLTDSFGLSGLVLQVPAACTIFDIATASMVISNCLIVAETAGEINSEYLEFRNCGFYGWTTPLVTGTGTGTLKVTGCNSTAGEFFDFTGSTFDLLVIGDNTWGCTTGQVACILNSGDATQASIYNNTIAVDAYICSPVDEYSDNVIFTANTGQPDTITNVVMAMEGNATATVDTGPAVWDDMAGSGDTICSQQVGFAVTANPLEIEYIGLTRFNGVATISGCCRRDAGAGVTTYSIGMKLNGTVVQSNGVDAIAKISTTDSIHTFSVSIPVTLVTADLLKMVIRHDGAGAVDSLVDTLQISIR